MDKLRVKLIRVARLIPLSERLLFWTKPSMRHFSKPNIQSIVNVQSFQANIDAKTDSRHQSAAM